MLAILAWRTVSSMYPTTQCIMGIRVLAFLLLPILALADDNILDKAATDAVNSFSMDLFKEVLKRTEGNVVVSPVSVSTLLAMLHQGAGGDTKTQMTAALHGEPEQTLGAYKKITHSLKNVSNETLLEFANGIFLNRGYQVRPKFKQHLEDDFLSEIAISNFVEKIQAAEQINKWVSEHTHDKIKELVKPSMFSELTRAALVNAIYFKDTWETRFEPEATSEETFYGDSEKKVPMMHADESYFITGEFDDLQAQWLELPFKGKRFSMIIVLPKEKNGLPNTLTKITSEHFSTLRNDVEQEDPERVILSLPKFKISSTIKLIPILKPKMPDLFTPLANLSGVSEENVFVSEAIQKAEIEADEKGATAAAATAIILVAVSAVVDPAPPVVFNANHPFLVFIMDNVNGVILFAAQVLDP